MNPATKRFYEAQDWAAFKNYWINRQPPFQSFVELIQEDFVESFLEKYDENEEIPFLYKAAMSYMLSQVDWEAIAQKIIE